MPGSPVIQEWIDQGRDQGRKEGAAMIHSIIIRMLTKRLGSIPLEIHKAIEKQKDLAVLDQWSEMALEAASLEEFRKSTGL